MRVLGIGAGDEVVVTPDAYVEPVSQNSTPESVCRALSPNLGRHRGAPRRLAPPLRLESGTFDWPVRCPEFLEKTK